MHKEHRGRQSKEEAKMPRVCRAWYQKAECYKDNSGDVLEFPKSSADQPMCRKLPEKSPKKMRGINP